VVQKISLQGKESGVAMTSTMILLTF